MRAPRPDGLSSQAEYDRLIAIEHALERLVTVDCRYVGRCTSAGHRDFYCYDATPDTWDRRVREAMAAFPEYEIETGHRSDPAGEVYSHFLMPGPRDRERLQNRRVCAALRRDGDPLADAREVTHWLSFPSDAARRAFIEDAQALGYSVRNVESREQRFAALLVKTEIPSEDTGLDLWEWASDHGGEYDGWECEVAGASVPIGKGGSEG
jgi:hypothetical protein